VSTDSTKFIFITGGVVSSLGKGLASASLGALLQARGYKVRLRKLDPYLNVDPGTMSPMQHGEVFVTNDGAETDLDLGHYERFTGVDARKGDNVTTGKIYSELLQKERRGDYLGGTVQVIPHVTDLIKDFVLNDTSDADFILCEIGGTIGDIEGLPFYEAIRQLRYQFGREKTMFIHLTLVPYIAAAGELKTKPTQHSVKELRSIGIQADLLLCRAERPIPVSDRQKIALFCNIKAENVIPAIDVKNIYEVPVAYHESGLDTQVLAHFGISPAQELDLSGWHEIAKKTDAPKGEVKIALVGKYNQLSDAYKSLLEALSHGGLANDVKVKVKWIDAESLDEAIDFTDIDAILVPGGFGERGARGKIEAIRIARERKIPFLGICFGMQMAVVEFAQNIVGLKGASTTEFGECVVPIVGLMKEWMQDGELQIRKDKGDLGGTMRLGAYDAKLAEGSKAAKIYGTTEISERHRHRYEVNAHYKDEFEKNGMNFSGMSPDGLLPEIIEIPTHPWFVAVQFHPELKSRPFEPHPLFVSFVEAAKTMAEHKDEEVAA
jgi:CTP synthase